MAEGFSATDVVKLAGVSSYDTLDYWSTSGFLRPSIKDTGEERRARRRYSFSDVVAARVAVTLRAQGVSLQALRRIVARLATLKDSDAHPLAAAHLVVSGKDVLVAYDRATLLSLLEKPGQGAFRMIVELKPIVREMETAVNRLRKAA